MTRIVNFLDAPYELRLESFKWRTSPQVDEYFQLHNLTIENHEKWLNGLTLDNPRTIAFFIEFDGKPVGATFFQSIDWEGRECEWGIYIYDVTMRGKGIGTEALLQCLDFAHDTMRMKRVYLEVLSNNHVAQKSYESAGFIFMKEKSDSVKIYVKELGYV